MLFSSLDFDVEKQYISFPQKERDFSFYKCQWRLCFH